MLKKGIFEAFLWDFRLTKYTDSIKRWKSWLYEIRKLLFVTIRTRWSLISDNILKLVLSNSLLLSFREELRYNWLQILLKLIYNYLQPFY